MKKKTYLTISFRNYMQKRTKDQKRVYRDLQKCIDPVIFHLRINVKGLYKL